MTKLLSVIGVLGCFFLSPGLRAGDFHCTDVEKKISNFVERDFKSSSNSGPSGEKKIEPLQQNFENEYRGFQLVSSVTGSLGMKCLAASVRQHAGKVQKAAGEWLAKAKVENEPFIQKDGSEGLLITPTAGKSDLNQFAHDLQERFGTKVVYSTETLYLRGGLTTGERTPFICRTARFEI